MKRFEKAYEGQRAEKPLIDVFLGRKVKVKVSEDLTVEGTLVYYQFGRKTKPHSPHILILKDDSGRLLILRGNWLSISGGENGRR
jgi:hypothetical protein